MTGFEEEEMSEEIIKTTFITFGYKYAPWILSKDPRIVYDLRHPTIIIKELKEMFCI
jgi:hypothetical protein